MSDSDRGGRGNYKRGWRFNRGRGNYRRAGSSSNGANKRGGGSASSSDLPQNAGQSSRQNHITDSYSVIESPYKGWDYYFPAESYVPTSRTVQKIKWMMQYFLRDGEDYDYEAIEAKCFFSIDYHKLSSDEILLEVWPQLKEDLYTSAAETLSTFSIAMHQIIIDDIESQQSDTQGSSTSARMLRIDPVPYVRARLFNFNTITPLKNLRADLCGKLVAVNGTVVRSSNMKPLCLAMAFKCRTCSGIMVYPQTDGKYEIPSRCNKDRNHLRCTGNAFDPMRDSTRNVIVEWQSIRIQECYNDSNEVGRVPRSEECELMEDLVDACSPGEVVTIVGIVKLATVKDSTRNRSKDNNMFTHYVEAVAVQNRDRGNNTSSDDASNDNSTLPGQKGLVTFNHRDYLAINKIHSEPNLFAYLVASLCPSIFGHEMVKAGLLLGLLGGNYTQDPLSQFSKRPDIHVLVVGDPGLGKSQMLHACTMVTARGVYVCGSATTSSGLTVTLTKDAGNGNEYSLEAGALVMGDQGTTCIDEFDKMSGQYQALLEAMEQQSISIAKAGILCTLPARTSILAAANPVGGHYNRAKTVSENIKLGPALLSRFDLVFLLLDKPDLEVDTMMTEHIFALHAGSSKVSPSSSRKNAFDPQNDSLKSRLRVIESNAELLPHQLLRKFIAYARTYVHPKLDEEAKKAIQDFYMQLRQSHHANDSTPITLRQLESLVRLAQARAKAELREEVSVQDALDVIELVKASFDDVFRTDEGNLDFSRSTNGAGMSQRNQVKTFVDCLQKKANRRKNHTFTYDELKAYSVEVGVAQDRNFRDFIEIVNTQGYLLKVAEGYRLLK